MTTPNNNKPKSQCDENQKVSAPTDNDNKGRYKYASWDEWVMSGMSATPESDEDTDSETDTRPHLDEKQINAIFAKVYLETKLDNIDDKALKLEQKLISKADGGNIFQSGGECVIWPSADNIEEDKDIDSNMTLDSVQKLIDKVYGKNSENYDTIALDVAQEQFESDCINLPHYSVKKIDGTGASQKLHDESRSQHPSTHMSQFPVPEDLGLGRPEDKVADVPGELQAASNWLIICDAHLDNHKIKNLRVVPPVSETTWSILKSIYEKAYNVPGRAGQPQKWDDVVRHGAGDVNRLQAAQRVIKELQKIVDDSLKAIEQ